MRRTQVQLDEETYGRLRREAFDQGISMSALIRQVLQEHLGTRPPAPKSLADFKFIASGRSSGSDFEPMSERHDEALAEPQR